jgi:CMP-N-acetylneuraminic acid synthetase
MICALLVGRGGSVGFPKKNIYPLLNRPLMSYPLLAAKNSSYVDAVYVSSDSQEILNVGKEFGAKTITRPPELATNEATIESAFFHGYEYIKKDCGQEIEYLVILMCNAVSVLPKTIDKGVEILRSKKMFDSAVTVSAFNMFTPVRARKIIEDGSLAPFVPFESFNFKIESNREKQETVYFHDCGVSVVRPNCMDCIDDGLLPQKWMGQKIYPLVQEGVLDVDVEQEMPLAEFWLKKNGFSETTLPYKIKNNS